MDRVTKCTWWNHKKYDPEFYRVVFMSSAPIGVSFLQNLNEDKRFEVVWVATNPDERSWRWMKIKENIIKKQAKEIFQKTKSHSPVSKVLVLDWLWWDGTSHRIPRLKAQLEQQWIQVENPKLPNNDNPNLHTQIDFLQKNYGDRIDENTAIVCHSLWSLLANHFIPIIWKKIHSLVHIWPAFSQNNQHKLAEKYDWINIAIDNLQVFHNTKIDYQKIQKLTWNIFVFLSKDDPYIPFDQAKKYYKNNFQKAKILEFQDKWHFNSTAWIKQLREILETLNVDINFIQTPNSLRLKSKKYSQEAKDFFGRIKAKKPDFIIVIAYWKIIPKHILDIPVFWPINVHGSLLPKYRWASPIQSVFLNQESQTGITIMKMDEWLDTWNIIDKLKINIKFDWTVKNIIEEFQKKWPKFLNNTLRDFWKEFLWEQIQGKEYTECKKIEKQDWKIDLQKDTISEIYRKYRAYFLRPKIYFEFQHKNWKYMNATIEELQLDESLFNQNKGELLIENWKLNESINKISIKPEWKKTMDIESFLNWYLK